ncbi:glycosyltransferase family 4 protein [Endozoicomonas sp. G2_1]|uniref:glycosyltransferase family 4 protein n=1 Tax=Endozoicomonas sp. G2_1 TaxID=2821091 RepID=UPI001ADC1F7F|nr:glycosyltransferase family 4 protein [Endozoicomonas sp. G2_1]MBO9490481.1 glycosyltransferase family 4 protein [Endozoicomonas sp. G2_1]
MRLPWKIKRAVQIIVSNYVFIKNCLKNIRRHQTKEKSINVLFYCRYEGNSGGSIAVAAIAKILSNFACTFFYTRPSNNLNKLYTSSIFTTNLSAKYDWVICDDTTTAEEIQTLREKTNSKILVTCHCLLDSCHGRPPIEMRKTLDAADIVHFVDRCQQDSFQLEGNKFFVIPNVIDKIEKTVSTTNVGCVGDLDQPRKNLGRIIDIFELTNASKLHLWRVSTKFENNKIKPHYEWEQNKSNIYNTFDVLIFPSHSETFGLVVAEALSAGIPCVISDIPAFTQYRECEAVYTIQNNDNLGASEAVNNFLENKRKYTDSAIQFWKKNYSPSIVESMWRDILLHSNKAS